MKQAIKKKRCSETVTSPDGWRTYQCQRNATRDGFCKQHHPDSVAERDRQKDERFKKKQESSPWHRLARANEEIARQKKIIRRLSRQVARLKAQIEGMI